jgi:PAS domain S-box-containing protein
MEFKSDMESKNKTSSILAHSASSIVSLSIGSLVYFGTVGGNKNAELRLLYERNDSLTKQIEDISRDNLEFRLRYFECQMKNADSDTREEILEAFIESVPFPMWIKNAQFEMVRMNTAYTAVFGITKQEYIGFNDYDVYPKEIADQYRLNDQLVLNSNRSITLEEYVLLSDGTRVKMRIYKFRVLLYGDVYGLGGVAIDLE